MRTDAKLIYVGAPYSDPDPAVIAGRMAAFEDVVARLLTTGQFPVSPLMNHGILGRHAIPGDWDFWQHYSRRLLARCDLLMVVQLPGWANSRGLTGEIALAETLSLPIEFARWSQDIYQSAIESHRQLN